MALGNYTLFDRASYKHATGAIDLGSDSLKAILCNASQVLTKAFLGSSGDCRLSDITGQLSTANGYTSGGVALTSVSLDELSNLSVLSCDDIEWTLSGAITFKYLLIFDDTDPNDSLVALLDIDDTSTSTTVTTTGSELSFHTPNGLIVWENQA